MCLVMINFMVVVDFFVYALHIIFLHVCLYLPHVHSSIPFSLFSPVNIYIYIFFPSFDIPPPVSESASSIESVVTLSLSPFARA